MVPLVCEAVHKERRSTGGMVEAVGRGQVNVLEGSGSGASQPIAHLTPLGGRLSARETAQRQQKGADTASRLRMCEERQGLGRGRGCRAEVLHVAVGACECECECFLHGDAARQGSVQSCRRRGQGIHRGSTYVVQ